MGVRKVEQCSFMQITVLNDTNAWYWVNVPYLMQQLQGRYRQSEVEECQVPIYVTVGTFCPLTQACLWPYLNSAWTV